MGTRIRRVWAAAGAVLAAGGLALGACDGKVVTTGGGPDLDAAAFDDAAETSAPRVDASPLDAGDASDAQAEAEGSDGRAPCVTPTLPHGFFCAPPGGTNSSAFDPGACGVEPDTDGGVSCKTQCAAWFDSPLYATSCVAAETPYIDAGPAGWLVCACNIP